MVLVCSARDLRPQRCHGELCPNHLQTLKILSDLVDQDVSHHLVGLAVLVVFLPIKGPAWDLVLTEILKQNITEEFRVGK